MPIVDSSQLWLAQPTSMYARVVIIVSSFDAGAASENELIYRGRMTIWCPASWVRLYARITPRISPGRRQYSHIPYNSIVYGIVTWVTLYSHASRLCHLRIHYLRQCKIIDRASNRPWVSAQTLTWWPWSGFTNPVCPWNGGPYLTGCPKAQYRPASEFL